MFIRRLLRRVSPLAVSTDSIDLEIGSTRVEWMPLNGPVEESRYEAIVDILVCLTGADVDPVGMYSVAD